VELDERALVVKGCGRLGLWVRRFVEAQLWVMILRD
jgi:hypothetical protein